MFLVLVSSLGLLVVAVVGVDLLLLWIGLLFLLLLVAVVEGVHLLLAGGEGHEPEEFLWCVIAFVGGGLSFLAGFELGVVFGWGEFETVASKNR